MHRRKPGSTPSLPHALLCLLVALPLFTAAQQQQPLSNVYHRSPPENAALDPSNKDRRSTAQIITPHRNGKDTAIVPTDERALATVAPAESLPAVRAHSARPSGLSSRLPARNLQDWQVEDLILLATVDGKIHARERGSGAARWELEADKPMVETTYHRTNKSTSDQVPGEDDFLWIVEPSVDGALYVYAPGPRLGMQKLGLTVKQLVEELSPYAGDDPPVVYTAEKRNTLYTVDASNGNILKSFSSAGSSSNSHRSCKKVNALESLEEKECEPIGTLSLGRTEYIVSIQDKDTLEQICTIRYFEWGPNNRDKDLHAQYASTLDDRYVYSKHDGSIMALQHATGSKKGSRLTSAQDLMYSHKFASPVARVFDVVKPYETEVEARDPSLVILPQPIGPVHDEFPPLDDVFVGHTDTGSWYALSEQNYPLVTDGASLAKCYGDDIYMGSVTHGGGLLGSQQDKLVGVHPLSLTPRDPTSIPTISGPEGRLAVGLPADISQDVTTDVLPRSPKAWTTDYLSPWTMLVVFICTYTALARTQKQWLPKIEKLAAMGSSNLASTVSHQQSSQAAVSVEQKEPLPMDRKVRFPEPAEETIFPVDEQEGSIGEGENQTVASAADSTPQVTVTQASGPDTISPPKEKKARRGVRGGRQAKQKKLEAEQAQQRRRSTSQSQKKSSEDDSDTPVIKTGQVQVPQVITVDASESPMVSGRIQINSLVIDTDHIIGHGSAGTCVFKGTFEGREVAVKRMLSQYYELASQEVSFLQQSDDHENVIRYFCQQKDQHFLYIAVELCQASLWDLYYSDAREEDRRQQLAALLAALQLDVPKALSQLAAGLQHLHQRRIIHRDIKPQNILIAFPKKHETRKGPRLVISDFGLCKTLPENVSTLVDPTGNAGTCGWKAPELISQPKDTLSNASQQSSASENGISGTGGVKRAADIFSLGCLFFWVLTGGCHPFDDKEGWMQMRELNIKKNNLQNMHKLDLGSDTEEPMQLVAAMLAHKPEDRPTASDVLAHPFFWPPDKRLAFLCDVSDHFEREPREPPSAQLDVLESWSEDVIERGDFLRQLDRSFVDTLGKQRKYTGSRMLDLLRALRNKKNHYEDMPDDVKKRVGALPAGYLQYWTIKFPKLLMACYWIIKECGMENSDRFKGYYNINE